MRKNLTPLDTLSVKSTSSPQQQQHGDHFQHPTTTPTLKMPRSESQSFLNIADTSSGEVVSTNFNTQPFSDKAAWFIYILVLFLSYWALFLGCLIYSKAISYLNDSMINATIWTALNCLHSICTLILFHWKKGSPYDLSIHLQDQSKLTFWEQLDNQKQFTPTRKFMFAIPCVLLLLTSWHVGDSLALLFVNFVFTLIVVLAKLPSFHRRRLFGINE
ncbi:hypothetical protein C9374_012986 [Naegleria lovaniensis]|uniref:Uncharacterized protein n=1 Tax=Naegleria lovaniensis TaxID=51637 RepID=A0AA88GA95_NAELO|nr:uncharacterized protein C9374_012986 [Naegleria lovaniensis]KAG2372956.1 hypothetical protein C9374_012986 [Naegleria lovaniensis]